MKTASFTFASGVVNAIDPATIMVADPQARKLIYSALADCVNFDLDDRAKATRRDGYSIHTAGAAHSGWGNGRYGFVIQGGVLKRVSAAGVSVVRSGLSGRRVMFCDAVTAFSGGSSTNDVVLYSNGEVYGMISGGQDCVLGSDTRRFKAPMVPGQCLAFIGGRAFVGQGSNVICSEPYDPETRDTRLDTLPFDAPVTMLCGTDGGFYVGTTKGVYWHDSVDPTKITLQEKVGEAAVYGNALELKAQDVPGIETAKSVAVWVGQDGLTIGTSSGQAIPVSLQKYVSLPDAVEASLFLRKRASGKHIIISLRTEA